jgi:non-ribosomal peptide synthetase component F
LIGFLLDTHVLRTDLSENPTFRELIGRIQQSMLGVYSHQAVPFHEVVQSVRPERSLSYSPLFQVLLNWRDPNAELQFIGFPGLITQSLLAQCKISKFDLTFFVTDAPDNILLEIEYNTDLFDEVRIERMVGHLTTILEGAAADPQQHIAQLPMLSHAERHQLLVEWNADQVEEAEEVA